MRLNLFHVSIAVFLAEQAQAVPISVLQNLPLVGQENGLIDAVATTLQPVPLVGNLLSPFDGSSNPAIFPSGLTDVLPVHGLVSTLHKREPQPDFLGLENLFASMPWFGSFFASHSPQTTELSSSMFPGFRKRDPTSGDYGGKNINSGPLGFLPVVGDVGGLTSLLPIVGGGKSGHGILSSLPVVGGKNTSGGLGSLPVAGDVGSLTSSLPIVGGGKSGDDIMSSLPLVGGKNSSAGLGSLPVVGDAESLTSSLPIVGGGNSGGGILSSLPLVGDLGSLPVVGDVVGLTSSLPIVRVVLPSLVQ